MKLPWGLRHQKQLKDILAVRSRQFLVPALKVNTHGKIWGTNAFQYFSTTIIFEPFFLVGW